MKTDAAARMAALVVAITAALLLVQASPSSPAPQAAYAEGSDIASGTDGTAAWRIDASGKLWIAPSSGDSGALATRTSEAESWPWAPYASRITAVEVSGTVGAETSIGGMFQGLTALKTADLTGLDTSGVINMHDVFQGDSALTSVNLSNLDTSKAETIRWFFGGCSSLKSADLSGWKTPSVSDWNYAFAYCGALRSIDISGMKLDQSILSRSAGVFDGDGALELATVSDGALAGMLPAPTAAGTDGKWVRADGAYGPLSPAELASSWTDAMAGTWAWSPASCTVIYDPNGGTGTMAAQRVPVASGAALTSNAFTREESSFYGWNTEPDGTGTAYADGSSPAGIGAVGSTVVLYAQWGLPTGKLTDSVSWVWDASTKTLTVKPTDGKSGDLGTAPLVPQSGDYEKQIAASAQHLVVEGTVRAGGTGSALGVRGFPALETADMRGLDVSDMASLGSAFYNCKNLTGVDIRGWDTSKVTTTSAMFALDEKLEALKTDGLDLRNVTNMDSTFYGCSALKSADGLVAHGKGPKLSRAGSMFADCTSLSALDLSEYAFASDANVNGIVSYDDKLETVTLPASGGAVAGDLASASLTDEARWQRADGTYGPMKPSEMKASWTDAMAGTWARLPHYTVVYHDNFGEDRTSKETSDTGYDNKTRTTISYGSRTGYEFTGWNTEPDGSGTAYAAGATYRDLAPADGRVDLYAQWKMTAPEGGVFGGVDWVITSDGALVLSPHSGTEGAFPDSTAKDAAREPSDWPWDPYRSTIKSFRVEGGTVHSGNSTMEMLYNCRNMTSFDPYGFETSQDENMNNMFQYCTSITSLDLSKWDTSKCFDMIATFGDCSNLTTVKAASWDTSHVLSFNSMFAQCLNLKNIDVSKWDTGHAHSFTWMFVNCLNLTQLDVSKWNTSRISNAHDMFNSCGSLTSLDVSNWDTSSIEDMSYMFFNCSHLYNLDVSGWATGCLSNTEDMFSGDMTLVSIDVSNWAMGNVTDMSAMFDGCSSLTSIDVSNWDVSHVKTMRAVFSGCGNIKNINVSKWDTSNAEDMGALFMECYGLEKIEGIENLDTSAATSTRDMFETCESLKSLDLSKWDVSKVTSYDSMFARCTNLTELDISSWNLASAQKNDFNRMFSQSDNLQRVVLPANAPEVVGDMCHTLTSPKTSTGKWVREDGKYGPYTQHELADAWNADMAGAWVWNKVVTVTIPTKASWTGMPAGNVDSSASWAVGVVSDIDGTIDVSATSTDLTDGNDAIEASSLEDMRFTGTGTQTAQVALSGAARAAGTYIGRTAYTVTVTLTGDENSTS